MAKFCQDWVSKQVDPVIRPRKSCCAVFDVVSPESKEALNNEGELKLVVPSFYVNEDGNESKVDSKEEGKLERSMGESKESKHKPKDSKHKSKESKNKLKESKHKSKEGKHKSKESKHKSKEKKEKTPK